ncbi:hypothetical protein REPUB_Repub11eG0022100 [Reevesia pubescens]
MSGDHQDEAFAYAWSLHSSGTFIHVLNASIELGLFDIIARAGPGAHISASDIAAQLPTKNLDAPSFLDRMLRLLACYSLLTCSSRTINEAEEEEVGKVEKHYGLAPAAKAFVRGEDGGFLATFPPNIGLMEPWPYLKDFILEGGNLFERVHGMPFYQYITQDPTFKEGFNRTLGDISKFIMKKILQIYKGFEGLTFLVDVGGGSGATLNMIVTKYPSINGINYDLAAAPSYPGIQHVGGDMFSSIPKAEAIMIKDVLHNWNDERCLKLLKNCYDALPKNGKLIIISFVMPEEAESSSTAKHVSQLDITMFMHHGGKQRSEKEFKSLCKAAGFSRFQLSCYAFKAVGVMEFYK